MRSADPELTQSAREWGTGSIEQFTVATSTGSMSAIKQA
jgi:hypothetical protein